MLIIEARRERKPNPNFEAGNHFWRISRPFIEYTSASLITAANASGQAAWKYGRFEIRGRIDTRLGMWPVFWTLGQNGRWPSNGEIDIMEFFSGDLLANVVWGTNQPHTPKRNVKSRPIEEFDDPDWSNKFHVWTMDWDENRIVLAVDGEFLNTQDLSQTVNDDAASENPFHAPQSVLLSLAIGATNGGDPSQTEFPARLEVDYVRIYQKDDAPA